MRGRELLEAIEYIDDELVEEAAADILKKQKQQRKTTVNWYRTCSAAACILLLGAVSILAFQQNRKYEGATESAFDTAATDTASAMAETTVTTSQADMAVPEEVEVSVESAKDVAADNATDSVTAESATPESVVEELCGVPTIDDTYTLIEEFPPKEMASTEASSIVCYAAPEKGGKIIGIKLMQAIEYYEKTDGIYRYHILIEVFGDRPDNNGDGTYFYNELKSSDVGHEMLAAECDRLQELGYMVELSDQYVLTGHLTAKEIENFDGLAEYGYMLRFLNE